MSIIENQDRILEAIDQLRRRKARPDADRICNYLLRRFSVDRSETVAILNRIVLCNPPKVIKVTYKGSTSYRRPSTPKQVKPSKKYQQDFTTLLSSALSELIVQEPDYLDFGVPPDEFEKFVYEKEKPLYNKKSLKLIIQTEINKGTLVRLETGNLSLVDGNSTSAMEVDPSTSSDDAGARVKLEPPEPLLTDKQIKAELIEDETVNDEIPMIEKDVPTERVYAKRGRKKKTGAGGDKVVKGSAVKMEIDGFRDGARRKRAAKKVFDPSDNHQPSKRRGRPLGSKNKAPSAAVVAAAALFASPTIISKDKDKVEQVLSGMCCVCHKQKSATNEKLLVCRDCTNKAHPSCSQRKGIRVNEAWQCAHCKTCCVCLETDEYATMVICYVCDDAYHFSCHTPQIPHKIKNTFLCAKCATHCSNQKPSTLAKYNADVSDNSRMTTPRDSPLPDLPVSPAPDLPNPPVTASSSSGVSSGGASNWGTAYYAEAYHASLLEEELVPDPSIPDTSDWTVKQVSDYLREQGQPLMADVFLKQEIDGKALLLLKRTDVVGSSLFAKLGQSLRAYKQVKRLQIRRSENYLLCAW